MNIVRDSLKKERRGKTKNCRVSVEQTFSAFYRASLFNQRLNYKKFFSDEIIEYWELYLSELQMALSQMEEHEQKFLEDCCLRKANHKNSFFSKATYYRCLNQYSVKFLALFDYDLFHVKLANIYVAREPLLIDIAKSNLEN